MSNQTRITKKTPAIADKLRLAILLIFLYSGRLLFLQLFLSILAMSRVCQVTGKRAITGNNVSHAHNKTRRRFLPNLHSHRFWVASENRWVKLRLTAKAMRTIDKRGIDVVLAELRASGTKV